MDLGCELLPDVDTEGAVMTCAKAILSLFSADDIVMRPSEIIRRTGRKEDSVRTQLTRLVAARKLFHIGHSQYARCEATLPIARMRADRVAALERRVDELESELSNLRGCAALERRISDLELRGTYR